MQNVRAAHELLIAWEQRQTLFDLESLLSIAVLPEIAISDFLKCHYEFDLSFFFADQFYVFAVDGGGGEYALWNKSDIVGDCPVVLLDSEGQYSYLAPSLSDFVQSLPFHQNLTEISEDDYEAMVEDYEEWHGERLSLIQVEQHLHESLRRLKKQHRAYKSGIRFN